MKRDWTATSPWCEHSAQSWSRRHGGIWCDDCENYIDGWRREIRRPSTWLFVAMFVFGMSSYWWWP